MFAEVTEETPVGGSFCPPCPPLILNSVKCTESRCYIFMYIFQYTLLEVAYKFVAMQKALFAHTYN